MPVYFSVKLVRELILLAGFSFIKGALNGFFWFVFLWLVAQIMWSKRPKKPKVSCVRS